MIKMNKKKEQLKKNEILTKSKKREKKTIEKIRKLKKKKQ